MTPDRPPLAPAQEAAAVLAAPRFGAGGLAEAIGAGNLAAALADIGDSTTKFSGLQLGFDQTKLTAALIGGTRAYATGGGQAHQVPARRTQVPTPFPPSAALVQARSAQSARELNRALNQLRKDNCLTQGEIVRRDGKKWLSKPTVSRVCNSGNMLRHRNSLIAFVHACGAGHERDQWVAIWERIRENQPPRTRRTAADLAIDTVADVIGDFKTRGPASTKLDTPLVTATGSPVLRFADTEDASTDDDEVIAQIQVTRRHVRTATVVFGVAGLIAASGTNPTARTAGITVFAVAVAIALYEMNQMPSINPDTGDVGAA